jgi:branched-subunit amino acid aminotransferase/4-amino-4-deoxychorismate lyase
MTDDLASVDGELMRAVDAVIPATDEGFLRGDGIFEVLRVYDGRAFALHEHLLRLEMSARNLHLPLTATLEQFETEIAALLEARGGTAFDGCLRIVVSRGGRRLLFTEPVPGAPDAARVCFVTYSPTRMLDGIKSLSYAANMLAGRIARERGFDEALLTTPHGRVLEAPTASLFYVDGDGELCTPPLGEHILASITRQSVIDLTGAVERAVTSDRLLDAREAFLASTTREVQPVVAIEDREIAGPGERTRQAADLLRDHIRAVLAA